MKKILLILCGVTMFQGFSQDAEMKGVYVGGTFNYFDSFNYNSFLKENNFAQISTLTYGAGIQVNYVPKKFGFTLGSNLVHSNSVEGITETRLNMFNGKIGPTYQILKSDFMSFYVSGIYSYSMFGIRHQFNIDGVADSTVFQNFGGNIIENHRFSHSLGTEISFQTKFEEQEFILSVRYLFDINNSEYRTSGYNTNTSLPTEKGNNIGVSILYKL